MGHGLGWLVKNRGPRHGRGAAAKRQAHISWSSARIGPSVSEMMGRCPARPTISFSDDGRHPGPAHTISRFLAGTQSDPSHFLFSRPDPARPGHQYFQTGTARLVRDRWCGPSRAGLIRKMSRARPGWAKRFETVTDQIGPDRDFIFDIIGWARSGQADTFDNVTGRAGP